MPSKIYSCALSGIDAYGVEIEVDILRGLSRFTVVGLGDTAVQESKERVHSALVNSGATFPKQRKIVNLAPADTRKCGPSFDLPIAVGLLLESGQIPRESIMGALFIGELALDGSLRPVQGILACALFAKAHGFLQLYVPEANAPEACLIRELNVFPVSNLQTLIAHLKGEEPISTLRSNIDPLPSPYSISEDNLNALRHIKGSEHALRAVGIAAAGGHHLLMSGPPGSGKTLLAHHLPHLLPPLSQEESIELTKIYSVAGLLPLKRPVITQRPLRSVHHTASTVSLVGGGSVIRPGEISLAHRGVLFLDEIPEFPRSVLETLRQPLEEKAITISRASGCFEFPAHFTLVAAMNPCPCGYAGDPDRECVCTARDRIRYQNKLSGPLLDRLDLFVQMQRLSFDALHQSSSVDLPSLIQSIQNARALQLQRFGNTTTLNSDLTPEQIAQHCTLPAKARAILKTAMETHHLSTRAYFRILKVARTLADMEGKPKLHTAHILEALNYRLTLN